MSTEPAVNVRILFFAKTRELSGLSETIFKTASSVVAAELLDKICSEFNLERIKANVILAVNEHYCDNLQENLELKESDEVAVIPPISGG